MLAAANDDRYMTGGGITRNGTRGLKTILSRHDYIHQDQVRRMLSYALDGGIAIFCSSNRVAIRRQQFGQKMAFSWGIIDNQYVLDGHIRKGTGI